MILNVGSGLLTPEDGKDWRHVAVGDTLRWSADTDEGKAVIVTAVNLVAAFPPHRTARLNSASDREETGPNTIERTVPQLSLPDCGRGLLTYLVVAATGIRSMADTAYDSEPHHRALWRRNIVPVLLKRRREHGSDRDAFRWVVECTIAWLHQFRCLRIRWERRPDIQNAFITLAESLICLNFITRSC